MIAIAICRLDEHDVGVDRIGRIRQNGARVAAQIAAKQDRLPRRELHNNIGRPQQVAGSREADSDARNDFHLTVVPEGLQLSERTMGIGFAVQRQGWLMLRVAMLVGLAGVFFLDTGRIGKYEATKVGSAAGAEHAPAITLRHETRQISDVIQVSVRQHNRCERVGSDGKRLPIPKAQLLQTLEQPAIDEYAVSAVLQQVFGAGDGPGRAKKCQGNHARDNIRPGHSLLRRCAFVVIARAL